MKKIAIFYMIGQYGEAWKEKFFDQQLQLLIDTGLYEQAQFIDVFVKGRQPIEPLLDKINHITYMGDHEEDRPHNRKLYRAYNFIQQRIWSFAHANPDYKILFFHSLGVSHQHDPDTLNKKLLWKKYMETLLINHWQESTDLLEYYDCVGTEYIPVATYKNETIQFYAPHYQGFFWWANAEYIRRLDPNWFFQDVEWQSYLCELWIGSGNPKAYNYHMTSMNHYLHVVEPPYEEIINQTKTHLKELKNEL